MNEQDQLMNFIEKIREEGTIVLVEGINDYKAMSSLGIEKIIMVKNKPLYKIVDQVVSEYRKAVILTDLDKEGKKLFSVLRHQLCQKGVIIDNALRNFLFSSTKIRQIEGLNSYLKKSQIFKEELLTI